MRYQQGISREQAALLPARIEDYVAADHPVRVIDAFVARVDPVALGFTHAIPAKTGRPPYDPRDVLKLFVWGYLNQVRSTRGLEREAGRNLEVLWLLGGLRPDFKTLSNFRRANAEAITGVCSALVQFCRGQGLFGGTLVAIDGSKLQAVASNKAVWTAKRLARAQAELLESTRTYLAELASSEASDGGNDSDGASVQAALAALAKQGEQLDQIEQALAQSESPQHVATEPEAKRMRMAGQGFAVAYNIQIAVDSQHGLIVAHAATTAGNDHQQLLPMATLAQEALHVETLQVVADTGYQNGEHAQACEARGILPAVPMQEGANPHAVACFPKSRFCYEAASDSYRCPAGERLRRYKTDRKSGKAYYGMAACIDCGLRSHCTPAQHRTIVREKHADAVEAAARRADAKRLKQRRCLAEHPFGTIKRMMGLPRFLLRGLRGASTETALAITAYNLKRITNTMGVSTLLARLQPA